MQSCVFCGESLPRDRKPGFRDCCPRCGRELHICRHCRFYDPGIYNECREPQAERVIDKDRANFCEYFMAGTSETGGGESAKKPDPRSRLEDLFRK